MAKSEARYDNVAEDDGKAKMMVVKWRGEGVGDVLDGLTKDW